MDMIRSIYIYSNTSIGFRIQRHIPIGIDIYSGMWADTGARSRV